MCHSIVIFATFQVLLKFGNIHLKLFENSRKKLPLISCSSVVSRTSCITDFLSIDEDFLKIMIALAPLRMSIHRCRSHPHKVPHCQLPLQHSFGSSHNAFSVLLEEGCLTYFTKGSVDSIPLHSGRAELHLPPRQRIIDEPIRLYFTSHVNSTESPSINVSPVLCPFIGTPGSSQVAIHWLKIAKRLH